jgi:hypothetical protein
MRVARRAIAGSVGRPSSGVALVANGRCAATRAITRFHFRSGIARTSRSSDSAEQPNIFAAYPYSISKADYRGAFEKVARLHLARSESG